MRLTAALTAAALAGAAVAASAQTMKPGLWEMHNKMHNPQMNAAMEEARKHMASMPPEQRKQMEAMLAQQGVGMTAGGTAVRVCLTKEMIESNQAAMPQSDCKITRQSRSGPTMRMAFSCPNPPTTGEGEFTMASAESYHSRMKMKTTVDGQAQTMDMEVSGKWLGADCGNLKPVQPPKR